MNDLISWFTNQIENQSEWSVFSLMLINTHPSLGRQK